MDIRVGRALDLRLLEQSSKVKYTPRSGELKAKVLGNRTSRKTPVVLHRGLRERRANRIFKDPLNSKVITLLIENGEFIPEDIESGNYEVSIKFSKI